MFDQTLIGSPFSIVSDHWKAHLNEGQPLKLTNESQPFLKEKRVHAETLGHSQPEYKNCFGVEILSTRPTP